MVSNQIFLIVLVMLERCQALITFTIFLRFFQRKTEVQ
jgi:hypothetical protein